MKGVAMGNDSDNSIIRQFDDKEIRAVWVPEEEEWYFAIVDVVGVLSESDNPAVYWRVLKKRLIDEGNETVTNCNGLKMRAADGKMRKTDAANTEQLLRIIQSIPSKKAEPFKLWLAKVGAERKQLLAELERVGPHAYACARCEPSLAGSRSETFSAP